MMRKERRQALLGPQTSRRNKMALIAAYEAEGEEFSWMWKDEDRPYECRLLVAFGDGSLRECQSYDEDIKPKLKDNGP